MEAFISDMEARNSPSLEPLIASMKKQPKHLPKPKTIKPTKDVKHIANHANNVEEMTTRKLANLQT